MRNTVELLRLTSAAAETGMQTLRNWLTIGAGQA